MFAPIMRFNMMSHLDEILSHHREKEADPEAANGGDSEKQEAIKLHEIFTSNTLTAPNTMMVMLTNADITHTAMVDLFGVLRFDNSTFLADFFRQIIQSDIFQVFRSMNIWISWKHPRIRQNSCQKAKVLE